MSFGDAANSAPRLQKYLLGGSYPMIRPAQLREISFARHNNKGGSRITLILRRPKLAGILLAAIFPSPCILAVRLVWAKSMNSLTSIIPTLSPRVKIVNRNHGLGKSTFGAS